MGKIKKILENELVGGTQSTDVYPITSTKAVYDTDNKVLDDYIQHLKKTSTFAGIATPTTNPSTPNGNVFYIAGEGTYVNFSGLSVDKGELAALTWNGTWSKQSLKVGLPPNELNISYLFPTNGEGGTNRYTLAGAINQVPSEYRVAGVKVSFVNENEDTESWEFKGGSWLVSNFFEVGYKVVENIIGKLGDTLSDGDYPIKEITRYDNAQIGYVSKYTGVIRHIKFRVKQLRGDSNDGIHLNDSIVIPASQLQIDTDVELDVNIPVCKGDIIWAYYLCGCTGQNSPSCINKATMEYYTGRTYALSWTIDTPAKFVDNSELGDMTLLPNKPATVVEALLNINSSLAEEIQERETEDLKINSEIASFDGIEYNEGHYPSTFNEKQSQSAGYKIQRSGYLKSIKFKVKSPIKDLYINNDIIVEKSKIIDGENEIIFDTPLYVNTGDCVHIGNIYFDRTQVESYVWDLKQDSTRRFALQMTLHEKPKYVSTQDYETFKTKTETEISDAKNIIDNIDKQIIASVGYNKFLTGKLPQYLSMYKVSLFKDFSEFTGNSSFTVDNPQGFDIYENKYLFQGSYKSGTGGSIVIVDLETNEKLGKIKNIEVEHVNLIICGEKYTDDDIYPLLWVSSVANQNYDGVLIRLSNDLSGFTVINKFKYTGTQLDSGAHIIPYKDNKQILLYSFGIGEGANKGKILFVNDSILDTGVDITISDDDVVKSITFQAEPKMQGARMLGGQLCVPTGIGSTAAILFVNIEDGSIETRISMTGELYPFDQSEPEAVALYKNSLITMGKDKAEYRSVKFAIGSSIE